MESVGSQLLTSNSLINDSDQKSERRDTFFTWFFYRCIFQTSDEGCLQNLAHVIFEIEKSLYTDVRAFTLPWYDFEEFWEIELLLELEVP